MVRGWSSTGLPSLNCTANFEISSSDLSWIGMPSNWFFLRQLSLVSNHISYVDVHFQITNNFMLMLISLLVGAKASLPPLCALFGSLLVSVPMQVYGRRISLICICLPLISGFLLMGFTYFIRHKSMLYIGRMLTGFMNGAATPASQIYVTTFNFNWLLTSKVHQLCQWDNLNLKK